MYYEWPWYVIVIFLLYTFYSSKYTKGRTIMLSCKCEKHRIQWWYVVLYVQVIYSSITISILYKLSNCYFIFIFLSVMQLAKLLDTWRYQSITNNKLPLITIRIFVSAKDFSKCFIINILIRHLQKLYCQDVCPLMVHNSNCTIYHIQRSFASVCHFFFSWWT